MHENFNYFKLISKLLSSFPIFLCKLSVFSEREHENHKQRITDIHKKVLKSKFKSEI